MRDVKAGKLCTVQGYQPSTIAERIQLLEDREAIRECIYYYAYACDNGDFAGMAACFTDTGILKWGDIYDYQIEGREAILEHLQGIVGSAVTSTHLITNCQIVFTAKNSAIMHCYMYSWQCFREYPKKDDIYSYGRYEVQMIRDLDGEWRFQSFRLVMAGQKGGHRASEQYHRLWPPVPCERQVKK